MRNPFKPAPAKRLVAIREEVAELQRQIAVLDEQVVHLQQVEADARTDAVVQDSPVSRREHRASESDLRRAQREREALQAELDRLVSEQDSLLEQLLD